MNKKAFTLIELLVVISIIALLLAILMPALNIVKKKAAAVVCCSNVAQISKAWFMYAEDNKGLIVGSNTIPGNGVDPSGSWVRAAQDENGVSKVSGSVLEEKIEGYKQGTLWSYYEAHKVLHCPADKRYLKAPVHPSYSGIGGYRSYSIVDGLNGNNGGGADSIKRQSQIRRPSEKTVFLEESDGRGYNMNSWMMSLISEAWIDPFAIWHGQSSSLGFADGHAINHKWVDDDTLKMAEEQTFYVTDTDSEDIKFMHERYPHAGLL